MFTERYKITDWAVKLDKTLFEQIYAVKETAAYKVSVPVTEKGDKVNVIWNFDSAKLSATQPDATRYLYKYDETANKVELVGSFTTDDKGNISFTIDNCEEKALANLLLDGQQEPQTEQTTQGEENSETSTQPTENEGTTSKLPLIAIAAVIVIAGIIFFVIKKR